jgi:hypothetical protein
MSHSVSSHPRLSRRTLIGGLAGISAMRALPTSAVSTRQVPSLSWERVEATGPGPRWDHTLAADEAAGRLIVFGGRDADGAALSETWVFDVASGTWAQAPGEGPAARFGAAAAVEPSSGNLVVFGGQSADQFFNDTWVLNASTLTWALLDDGAGVAPAPRYGLGAVFDGDGRLLISHGFTFEGRFDDTWAFDLAATGWTDISSVEATRPLRRCLHEQVWDDAHGVMLLYGGCSSGYGPCPQGDLWTYAPSSATWTEATPAVGPAARSNPALVAAAGTVLLVGGLTEAGYVDDAWVGTLADGVFTWEQVAAATEGPEARASHDMVALDGSFWLFGGTGPNGVLADLWHGTLA